MSSASQFQIFTASEIESLHKAGKILRECLEETAKHVRPGISTGELDMIAEACIRKYPDAVPGFKGYHGYPATLCISVNEECVHGMPGKRLLEEGDIVSLDGGVKVDGLNTDACITVAVGNIPASTQKFLQTTKRALERAVDMLREGTHVGDVSAIIQETVEAGGYKCIPTLTGHGLGIYLHQFPDIPNVGKKGTGPIIPAGTIVAVEPITSMGSSDIREAPDGWTLRSKDGALTAHEEHTLLVLQDGCEILA